MSKPWVRCSREIMFLTDELSQMRRELRTLQGLHAQSRDVMEEEPTNQKMSEKYSKNESDTFFST